MILLLEGADCSGKTTLADTIKEVLKERAVYVHHTNMNNSIGEFSKTLNEAEDRRRKGYWTIIDRMWISEMIYGPIMRHHTNDPDGLVMRLCHGIGAITIMCVRQSISRHLAHFEEVCETRDEYARNRITSIIHAYHDLWYGSERVEVAPLESSAMYCRLLRYTPLKMLRSYYQYDMDKFSAPQFANWVGRLATQEEPA